MVRAAEDDDGPELADIPENAHVIVAARDFGAPAPESYPERMLAYEKGDELPYDLAEFALERHPRTLALVDDDGSLLAENPETDESQVLDAVELWKSGETFRAPEYDPDE